jgi:hypothetical protein
VEAFLETTAVVDLLFKDKGTRQPIQELLKQYEVKYSSQYVRMEIKRGVLTHFVYLHNKAVECNTLAEVQASVSGLSSTPHRNKLSTILKAVADFYQVFEQVQLKEIESNQKPAQFAKIMLAAFLRVRIKRFWAAFERLVDVVLDGAECYKRLHVLKPPEYDGRIFDNTLANCDRFKPGICRIKDFCKDNESLLHSIHEFLATDKQPDLETSKRRSALKDVLRVPNRDILRKLCWSMGDAVIIAESPDGAEIINGNCKHYDPMCKAAGKVSVCYRAAPQT